LNDVRAWSHGWGQGGETIGPILVGDFGNDLVRNIPARPIAS
jgi:hypothetical protein